MQHATMPAGLSSAEAARRRAEFGPNAVTEEPERPVLRVVKHLWAPVPWMLEASVILQLVVGERLEALMITTLLCLNVSLGVFQESRANAALTLLKQRLSPTARVRRDAIWQTLPAADLVPGDLVQLSLGGIVPADVAIVAGAVLLDQSMLTGQSIPADLGPGRKAFAGAMIRRGEATGEVVATGAHTYFGRAAELVRIASAESSEQRAVVGIVRALTVVNFAIVVGIVAYGHMIGMNFQRIMPLVLTALLSAVPVALPATFTLAATLGARSLATHGVLLTRLSALHEAAMIDVLCADKTGTLTQNELSVRAVRSVDAAYPDDAVCAFAAAASSTGGQDPIDAAIRGIAGDKARTHGPALRVARFVPFDPTVKIAEASVIDETGRALRVVKGAPAAVAAMAPLSAAAGHALNELTNAGYRTIAIAAGPPDALGMIGLIGFGDPPRADSPSLLAELLSLGVNTVMVTGDAAATATTVAAAIGLRGPVCPAGKIPDKVGPDSFAVYAGVFPEDKFRLVRAFQRQGHAVGMCGDGANDAPALRQAQMGIAVWTATDVAKAAAGIVLTDPGLGGIVTCIKEARSAFQRVLTYTLSILINKCATLVVLGCGLVMTGHAVLTPLLQALMMLASDFVTMSRAADRARPSAYPNAWRVRNLVIAAVPLAVIKLCYLIGMLAVGWYVVRLNPAQMQTLTFLTLALAGQGVIYVLRERRHFWKSHPAPVMLVASGFDVLIVTGLALGGVLMTSLPAICVAAVWLATIAFAFLLDAVKLGVRARLQID